MTVKTKTVSMYEHAYDLNSCGFILCSECAENAPALGPWIQYTPDLLCQNHREVKAERTRFICAASFSGSQEIIGLFSSEREAENAAMNWLEARSKTSTGSAEVYLISKTVKPEDVGIDWSFEEGCYDETGQPSLQESLSLFHEIADNKLAKWFEKTSEKRVSGMRGAKMIMHGAWPRIFKG